jgi:hypothetical protein
MAAEMFPIPASSAVAMTSQRSLGVVAVRVIDRNGAPMKTYR